MEKFKKNTLEDVNGWLEYIREDKDIIQRQMAEYYRKYVHIEQSHHITQMNMFNPEAHFLDLSLNNCHDHKLYKRREGAQT